ncbi:MAG: L-erythro-3,5-diaminohexanoate dehydrogenase [Candidatus Velthaea sp.]|jgi:L-erythro-3,5-diaminohexanoate dehydrogenase
MIEAPPVHRDCPLGSHRVIEPTGALPQAAWQLDNTPVAGPSELLCRVDVLNIDSASFTQIAGICAGDAQAIGEHILETVRRRGKQHNPVTGSGGMFVGRIAAVGSQRADRGSLAIGDRIASLVSLTLTPLQIEEVLEVDVATHRVRVRGSAILFESSIYARLPDDIDPGVALCVFDVAGAPAQVQRLARPGMTVCVIGADGKSGLLACAQAKTSVGPGGHTVGIVPSADSPGARLLLEAGYVDRLIVADARDALAVLAAIPDALPVLADLVVNCVNVGGTELASILCAREGGTVYFFSMATSFTAAALGAEGAGKDVTMIVGNGYARDHAQIALQTLRDRPPLHAYFNARYGAGS